MPHTCPPDPGSDEESRGADAQEERHLPLVQVAAPPLHWHAGHHGDFIEPVFPAYFVRP
jgi:hypothetical protein